MGTSAFIMFPLYTKAREKANFTTESLRHNDEGNIYLNG